MKKYKKTLTVVIILIVATIMFATFFGISKKNEDGEKEKLLPDYKLGMEFGESRLITAIVSDEIITTVYDSEGQVVEQEEGIEYKEEDGYKVVEQKVNEDAVKTLKNYKKAKKIIEERLEGNNVTEYFIELNEETGEIQIQIPEDENADTIQSMIKNSGNLILLDGETFETVLDSSYLKQASVMYSQGDMETGVFLQIEFNEEGTKKLQELNEIYVEKTVIETNENGEEEEVTESKVVWVILNDSFIGTTVLPNIVYNNKIFLSFGVTNDNAELQQAIENARNTSSIIKFRKHFDCI